MTKYNPEFKQQAVKKVLSRHDNQSVREIAQQLNVGTSTLWKWIKLAKTNQLAETNTMSKEKSPQDWSATERFDALLSSQNLNKEQTSAYCRENGLYPHHLKQWKEHFIHHGEIQNKKVPAQVTSQFKKEINALKKELNRKEKALAETAALLVLSKKCQAFWSEQKDV